MLIVTQSGNKFHADYLSWTEFIQDVAASRGWIDVRHYYTRSTCTLNTGTIEYVSFE